jgi:hypothetical protein
VGSSFVSVRLGAGHERRPGGPRELVYGDCRTSPDLSRKGRKAVGPASCQMLHRIRAPACRLSVRGLGATIGLLLRV